AMTRDRSCDVALPQRSISSPLRSGISPAPANRGDAQLRQVMPEPKAMNELLKCTSIMRDRALRGHGARSQLPDPAGNRGEGCRTE
ncbi:MAG: hypothetical protein ACR2PG_05765, partial [Hyphomicrobiaceae bacterium]